MARTGTRGGQKAALLYLKDVMVNLLKILVVFSKMFLCQEG